MNFYGWDGLLAGLRGAASTLVTPFLYRDNATFTEALELLRQRLEQLAGQDRAIMEQLIKTVEQLREIQSRAIEQMRDENAKRAAEIDAQIVEMRREIQRLETKIQAHNEGQTVMRGVVHGDIAVQPLRDVLNDIYDNARDFAEFARNIDRNAPTAKQYDEAAQTARRIDLGDAPKAEMGE